MAETGTTTNREGEIIEPEFHEEMTTTEVVELKNKWVSFEEESEVPFLPQPPSNVHSMSSERYIDRLERKLQRIKDPSNLTSKKIVTSLTEAREYHMNNMINNPATTQQETLHYQTNDGLDWNEEIRESNCCCVSCYKYFFSKRTENHEETECLLDEDELAISTSTSQHAGNDCQDQQPALG